MVDEITGPPPNYESCGDVYSNFDHELDKSVAARLRAKPLYAGHPAWDFHGTIWFEPEPALWHEVVKRYQAVVAHITGADIMDVIREANERFGNG